MSKLNSAQVHLRTVQTSLERALYAFTEAVDNLERPLNDEERARVEEHIEKASLLLSESEELMAQLEVRKQETSSRITTYSEEGANTEGVTPSYRYPGGRVELPRLPIPEFSGKSWQWDNFWELFNATVHSLPISNLQKFNYLLKALKGDARQSAERYQVTSENYPLVLEHLQKRYGTVSSIVSGLHERLEKWAAQSADLKDQMKLFDKISSLTQQLESKGENLDSLWLLSKILSKFRNDIRRRVLEKKVALPAEKIWTLREQMNTIESVLRQEEVIERYMAQKPEQQIAQKPRQIVVVEKKKTPYCFYCECTDHWSTSCTKLKLPKERMEHLKRSHRCLGCGSKNHIYAECNSKGCIHCGKKHHSSICFENASATSYQRRNEEKKNEKVKRTLQNFSSAAEDSSPIQKDSAANANPTVMAASEMSSKEKSNDIFLLTGALKVMHPVTKELQEVEVLLDTGAD
uniref:Peptidase A2 domain-containing protein n=1 Tax=Haemonchus contortus TaxID=6289 RepID=A0A7I4Y5H2_HAECO